MLLDYINEIGLICLDEIRLLHLEKYKAALIKLVKPKTAKNQLTTIASMFNHAVELDHIDTNPARNKKLMRFSLIQKNKVRFLSENEIKIVLNAVKNKLFYECVLCGEGAEINSPLCAEINPLPPDFESQQYYGIDI